MKKSNVIRIILLTASVSALLLFPLFSFAQNVYESKLDKGLSNTEPYSYILIKKAQADPANSKNLLKEAARHSPNLPAAYFELAKSSFSFSPNDIFESMDYVIQGLKAYKRNFWWLISITGLLSISLLSSLIATLVIVVLIRFFIEIPLLSHDITEEKLKILIILFLIPLSFLGPAYFIAGALSIFGLYFRKIDKAVVYISILLLFLSPLFMRMTNDFLSAFSPEIRAVVDVNERRDNKYAITALKGKNDYVSLFSYGLALKREGHYAEAITAYKSLLSSTPDPKAYVNIGNCYYAVSDMTSAKDSYQKAIDIKPLASAYYNLSQISREVFDFAKGEEYFSEATKLDSVAVSEFAFVSGKGPNRFVVDETLPMTAIWKYADSKARPLIKIPLLDLPVAVATAAALGILFFALDGRIRYRAYRCKRCNAVLCGICAKELLWGQMCAQCYGSIVKLDGLDSKGRVAKVLQVQERQSRKRNIVRVLAFTPPGIAYIISGRILAGALYTWLFLFMLVLIWLNPFFAAGIVKSSHDWLTIPAAASAILLYLISIMSVTRRLNRGWL